MNILILAAGGKDLNSSDGGYPFYLTEVEGITLIERLVMQSRSLADVKFLFAFPAEEIKKWHLDSLIKQLETNSELISVKNKTAGAACTALLAIEYIDNDEPLLILNVNDSLHIDFAEVVQNFEQRQLDAGTVAFRSVHPRYSYVALNADDYVVEAAEKNPISQLATTGFYWFARGQDFVLATITMIMNDRHVDNIFYICPVMNEMILNQAKIGVYQVKNQHYHPLKNQRQLQQYESILDSERQTCSTRV